MGEPKASARRALFRILAALIVAVAGGCTGGVHFVSQSPDGGVIAIPTNSDQWPTHYRSRAERLMRQTCPNGYVIDHEEVVVEKPARSGKEAPNDDEYYDYNGGLEKITRYGREEYRITFRCAPPPSPLPSPPSAPPRSQSDPQDLHMPAPLPGEQ